MESATLKTRYYAKYCEQDFFIINKTYCRMMIKNIYPEIGDTVLKLDGLYEISHCTLEKDQCWDIYLEPIKTDIKNNDTIIAGDKQELRVYIYCENAHESFFKKVDCITLLDMFETLTEKLTLLDMKVKALENLVN